MKIKSAADPDNWFKRTRNSRLPGVGWHFLCFRDSFHLHGKREIWFVGMEPPVFAKEKSAGESLVLAAADQQTDIVWIWEIGAHHGDVPARHGKVGAGIAPVVTDYRLPPIPAAASRSDCVIPDPSIGFGKWRFVHLVKFARKWNGLVDNYFARAATIAGNLIPQEQSTALVGASVRFS